MTTSRTSARTPGIMKCRLSSCGLNQTRIRAHRCLPARTGGASACGAWRARLDQLLRVSADQARGVAERDGRRVRVACRRQSPARVTGDASGRARRRSPRESTSASQARPRSRYGSTSPMVVTVIDDAEVARGVEAAGELAARARPVAVRDHDRHVAHVGRRRVPEHRQLQDRRDDDERRTASDPDAARGTPSTRAPAGAACQRRSRASRTDDSASIAAA